MQGLPGLRRVLTLCGMLLALPASQAVAQICEEIPGERGFDDAAAYLMSAARRAGACSRWSVQACDKAGEELDNAGLILHRILLHNVADVRGTNCLKDWDCDLDLLMIPLAQNLAEIGAVLQAQSGRDSDDFGFSLRLLQDIKEEPTCSILAGFLPLPVPVPPSPAAPVPTGAPAPVPTGPQAPVPTGPQAPVPTGPQVPVPTGPQAPVPTGPQVPVPTGPQVPVPTGPQAPVPAAPATSWRFAGSVLVSPPGGQNRWEGQDGTYDHIAIWDSGLIDRMKTKNIPGVGLEELQFEIGFVKPPPTSTIVAGVAYPVELHGEVSGYKRPMGRSAEVTNGYIACLEGCQLRVVASGVARQGFQFQLNDIEDSFDLKLEMLPTAAPNREIKIEYGARAGAVLARMQWIYVPY